MTEKQGKPKNEVIAQVTVNVEKVHPNILYLWQEWGTTKLDDGTLIVLGSVIPDGSLYIFARDENKEKERYHVSMLDLARKVLEMIQEKRKEKK